MRARKEREVEIIQAQIACKMKVKYYDQFIVVG